MDAEVSHGTSGECDDRVAEQAASFDEALAAGREPLYAPVEDSEGLSALLAAQASLRMLERVWPRSVLEGETASGPFGGSDSRNDLPSRWGSRKDWPSGDHPEDSSPSRETSAAVPAVFGRFRIVRELGQGGFGVVFLAIDPELNRPVALKVPRPGVLLDPESRARFVREARAVAALDHPNIVPLYEAGEVGPVCYLASACCEGSTLAAWLTGRENPVPPRRAAEILAPLADAMQHAHERGVLHRDLKPSNVLLHRALSDGARPMRPGPEPAAGDEREFVARIIDFGLARLMDRASEDTTASFAGMGSAPFMAPEQAEGKRVGPATDVYGLGALLYAMLCGRAPHRGGNDLETLRRVVADDPIPPRRFRPEIPRDLEAICLKCLEKDPARRYGSARELADDLGRFLAGASTRARPASAAGRVGRAVRRHPARFAALALAGVLAVAGVLAARWYEGRLDQARHISHEMNQEIGRHRSQVRLELESRRRSQYLADLRLAAQFVQSNQIDRAIGPLERQRPRAEETNLREFAWYYLMGRCRTEHRALVGHRGDVYHVEFSPDGALLASAGKDGVVRLWRTSSWRLVRPIAASTTEVNAAAFSPDGATLAVVDDEGKLALWEVATDRRRWEVLAHAGEALNARFTRDGKRIVTAGRNDHSVKVWIASTGGPVASFRADGFLLAPDEVTVATLKENGEIDLYDTRTREHRASLRVGDGIQTASFSHDGRWLAVPHGANLSIRLWDVLDRRVRHELRGHNAEVGSVAFTPDDRKLVSGSRDGTIRIWDVGTGQPRGVHLGHHERIWGLAVSPDGRTIASAGRDGIVRLWDPGVPETPARLAASGQQQDLAFSPDSRDLIGIGADGVISTWNAATGETRETWRAAAARPSSNAVLSANGRIAAVLKKDGTIALYDLQARRLLGTVPAQAGEDPCGLALDADGRRLAVARCGRGGSLWTVPGMSRLATLEGDVHRMLFVPGGGLLCATESGDRVISWNPADGRKETILSFEWTGFDDASLSPNGRFFARTNWRSIHLRPLDSLGHPLDESVLEGHPYNVVRVAFSPDGRTLASGDCGGVVKLWDVAAREELLTLGPHSGSISAIRFSPDGRNLATCGVRPDGTAEVLLWRAPEDSLTPAANLPR